LAQPQPLAQPQSVPQPLVPPQPVFYYPQPVRRSARQARSWPSTTGARILAALAAFSSCGFGTWALVALFAVRRRSVVNGLAAIAYLFGIYAVFITIINSPDTTEANATDFICVFAGFLIIFGGSLHVYLLAGPLRIEHHPEAVIDGMAGQVRREQAVTIAVTYPQIARELGIGRPDLPRWFDDGGVVDVNSAPETVLAIVPEVGWQMARQIVVERTYRGPFISVEDLAQRAVVPAAKLRRLEPWLVALPVPGD
jgi:hypothetical protein